MPIEFRCSQCGALLRTGDETAGKQAKCPTCGAIQPIPMTSQPAASTPPSAPPSPLGSPFGIEAPVPRPSTGETNPYQSPAASAADAYYAYGAAAAPGNFAPTPIDAGDILSRTWLIFKGQWAMCTAAVFITGLLSGGVGFVLGQIEALGLVRAGLNPNTPAGAVVLQTVVQVTSLLFSTWIELGLWMFMLRVARGEAPDLMVVFTGGRYYLTALPARLLYALMYLVGISLCVVPGIILGLMFWQYLYVIIDRKAGVMDSFRLSNQLTTGNKGHLFLLILATIPIVMLGLLACCVGAIVAQGYIALMWVVTYLAMSGQPTADMLLTQPVTYTPGTPPGELR